MVLLIDTNILLDVLCDRQEFVEMSSVVWKMCETGKAKGYVSALSFANMMYVMRNELSPDSIAEVFVKLKLIFEFADLSSSIIQKAVNMKWNDFEDAVQCATAENIHADYIITRNIKDFVKSKVLALMPEEVVARI